MHAVCARFSCASRRVAVQRPAAPATTASAASRSRCARRMLASTAAAASSVSSAPQSQVRIIESLSNDPYINLAAEDWIYTKLDPAVQTLFLWRNGPSVIIGRNQNPWKECHLARMTEKGVNLVRRQSGGGAVYQDLGNAIFTFLSSRETYSKERNSQIIINALQRRFGITANASGRNDILTDGLKFSGSAYKLSSRAALHHGTIMLYVDVDALQGYLNPSKEKLQSKGVASVKSRVVNLRTLRPDIRYEDLNDALREEFCRMYGQPAAAVPVERFDADALLRIEAVRDAAAALRDWNWLFSETPEFNHHLERRFEWGTFELNVFAEDGVVRRALIHSDSLYPHMIEAVRTQLTGAKYHHAGVSEAIQRAKTGLPPECEPQLEELRVWLLQVM